MTNHFKDSKMPTHTDQIHMKVSYYDGMVNIDTREREGPGDFNIAVLQGFYKAGDAIGVQFNPLDGIEDAELDRALKVLGGEISDAIKKYVDTVGIKRPRPKPEVTMTIKNNNYQDRNRESQRERFGK